MSELWRWSEKSRRVIFFSQYEASTFGALAIETHHLLLGLLREAPALLEPFIKSRDEIEQIREELLKRFPIRERVAPSADLPLSAEAQRVMDLADKEADKQQQRHVQPQHIVIGLLRVPECSAAVILRRYGVEIEVMRSAAAPDPPQPKPVSVLEMGPRSALESVLHNVAANRFGAVLLILGALSRNKNVTINVTSPDGTFSFSFGDQGDDTPLDVAPGTVG
jgi:ATP-dependent Clp protease ATP-binding subunit ClpA